MHSECDQEMPQAHSTFILFVNPSFGLRWISDECKHKDSALISQGKISLYLVLLI